MLFAAIIINRHVNATKSYLHFGKNWVFYRFGKYRLKHTIQDLVQMWSQNNYVFMKEIRKLQTIKNKTKQNKTKPTSNLNTKRRLTQNSQNADTILIEMI